MRREEGIDLLGFFIKIMNHWYLFVISIILFLTIALLYLRYTSPIYQANGTILIRDKNNNKIGAENLIQGLELFSNGKNLENEIGIINSYGMINKAIKSLEFEVSYFAEGKVRRFELYKKAPFKVVLNDSSKQLGKVPFNIDILSDSTYELKLAVNNLNAFIIPADEEMILPVKPYEYNKILNFGDTCKTDYFNFVVIKNDKVNINRWKNHEGKLFFIINNLEEITQQYVGKLRVNPINKKGSIVRLEVDGPVLEKEIDFINELANQYIQNNLEEKNLIATNTIKFIDEQLAEVSKSLNGTEVLLEKYRQSNKVMDLEISSINAFQDLANLDNQKAQLLVKDKYYKYLLKYVNENSALNAIVAPSSIGIDDPLLINLVNELNDLYSRRAALGLGVESKNPSIVGLNEKIINSKKTLIENLKNILNSSKIALEDIENRIAKTNTLINKLPKTERDLVSIKRSFNINDHIYNYLLEKRAEAGIAKAANTPDNKVIDYAKTTSIRPVFPKPILIYSVCLVFSLVLPFSFITIKNYLNNTIQGKEELLSLSEIPLLGVIGHNNKSNIPLIEYPKSNISESFRSVRINLQYLNSENIESKSRIIGITSTISGEGKTFCALNLATAIALSGLRTILVGADLRKPKLASALNINSDQNGLTSYLINVTPIEKIIQKSHVDGMDLILSGPIPPNPSELLGSSKVKDLFKYLKDHYDYIIVDSPPIGLVSDYFILNSYIDANLYIVRNNYTKRNSLDGVNHLYEKGDLKKLFLILNDVNTSGRYGYNYGYMYGYGYYEEEDSERSFVSKISDFIIRRNK